MPIIAYEGPAGSGKGFYISQLKGALANESSVKFLPRPSLPRDLGPQVGAWSSSYLEYMAISAAVMMPETTFYVDRFMLSRWVYKAIEDGGVIDPALDDKVKSSFHSLCRAADWEACLRIGIEVRPAPVVDIKVLIPSIGQLCANRRSGMAQGRSYPFSPRDEITLYCEVARRVDRCNIPGLTIDILEF